MWSQSIAIIKFKCTYRGRSQTDQLLVRQMVRRRQRETSKTASEAGAGAGHQQSKGLEPVRYVNPGTLLSIEKIDCMIHPVTRCKSVWRKLRGLDNDALYENSSNTRIQSLHSGYLRFQTSQERRREIPRRPGLRSSKDIPAGHRLDTPCLS